MERTGSGIHMTLTRRGRGVGVLTFFVMRRRWDRLSQGDPASAPRSRHRSRESAHPPPDPAAVGTGGLGGGLPRGRRPPAAPHARSLGRRHGLPRGGGAPHRAPRGPARLPVDAVQLAGRPLCGQGAALPPAPRPALGLLLDRGRQGGRDRLRRRRAPRDVPRAPRGGRPARRPLGAPPPRRLRRLRAALRAGAPAPPGPGPGPGGPVGGASAAPPPPDGPRLPLPALLRRLAHGPGAGPAGGAGLAALRAAAGLACAGGGAGRAGPRRRSSTPTRSSCSASPGS